jgi:hypothetical protein
MDKTVIALILLFLTVLVEYPMIFPVQPVTTPIESPAAIINPSISQTPQNSTEATPIIRQNCTPLPLTKSLKDSELWFTLRVPQDWNATTVWERGYGTWIGYYFYTVLGVEEPVYNQTGITRRINSTRMTIMTYAITRNQDQDYRNDFRQNRVPTPVESTETINGIVFDRFESKGEGTAVGYVVKKASANERGYATVIWYYVSPSQCQEDIENIIHSFRYLSEREILHGNVPGVEISIIHPDR